MVLSLTCLTLGVLSYGFAGAHLAEGSEQGVAGALRSPAWWLGTGLQGAGFLFTLVARHDLPLLLVQVAIVGALAVTAVVQHASGRHRLRPGAAAAVVGMVAGIAALGLASRSGHAPPPRWSLTLVLALGLVCCAAAVRVRAGGRLGAVAFGLASGVGFGVAAVGARVLISDVVHPLWLFWRLPLVSWCTGFAVVGGILLGQVHLTRGLARGSALPVLSSMYAMSSLLPMALGILLLGEEPRPGTVPITVAGLVLAGWSAAVLIRFEARTVTVSPGAGPRT